MTAPSRPPKPKEEKKPPKPEEAERPPQQEPLLCTICHMPSCWR